MLCTYVSKTHVLKIKAYYPTLGWRMESKEKEINITYETLFEILRREKQKEELQKLSETFFDDVVSYFKEKEETTETSHEAGNMFAHSEKEKNMQQLENIKRILKELYDKREKKIM